MGQPIVPGVQTVGWHRPLAVQLWPTGQTFIGPQSVGQPALPGVQLLWQTPFTQTWLLAQVTPVAPHEPGQLVEPGAHGLQIPFVQTWLAGQATVAVH